MHHRLCCGLLSRTYAGSQTFRVSQTLKVSGEESVLRKSY
jgi:hypothetical protein